MTKIAKATSIVTNVFFIDFFGAVLSVLDNIFFLFCLKLFLT